MNQRQATVNALLSALENHGIEFKVNGDVPISEVLNDKVKAEVRAVLFEGFRAGKISYKPEFQAKVNDDQELKKYISGLVNNWIRKAKELNCGQTYQPKNPGSRAGSGDEQVKEMRKLLKATTDAEARKMIQTAIDERLAEIKPKAEAVNVNAIPEHLRHLVPAKTEE
jgi:hypothetical protein